MLILEVKTYSFISGFVLRVIVCNVVAVSVLNLFCSKWVLYGTYVSVITVYLCALWVVLKLLQAHFGDKTFTVPYTGETKRKLNIALIVSGVACIVLLALNIPGFFSAGYDPTAVFYTSIFTLGEVTMPDVLAPLTSLPLVAFILLANLYLRMFYLLAKKQEIKAE